MIIDPIGDLLTRIRNGQLRRSSKVRSPNSRLRVRLLDVLQAEGFIRGYAEVEFKGHKELEIELKYHEGEPVIRELKRVSTPGRRVYSSVGDLKPHLEGYGLRTEAREALERLSGMAQEWTVLDDYLLQYCVSPEVARTVRASSFSASLELVREGRLDLRQDRAFAPIWVRRKEEMPLAAAE